MTVLKKVVLQSMMILGIVLLSSSLLLFVAWPSLITGSACDLTIDSIGVDSEGTIQLQLHALLAFNTEVVPVAPIKKGGITCVSRASWKSCPPRFLRWPRRKEGWTDGFTSQVLFKENGDPDLDSIRAGLIAKAGTYRLRPDESLLYYRGKDQDGELIEGRIEIQFTR